ncbi:hypothetical protein BN2497_9019 [Janthinobacterium sp. CG23_2]|nr:hypothetical protein BN2497_9019 [Janthinobacterium sp. CG23_2]CUU30907.1 hypothetical protein BN3177_9019 [Janthinobacterium sp. CG23_2]
MRRHSRARAALGGTRRHLRVAGRAWIPACAGMTVFRALARGICAS